MSSSQDLIRKMRERAAEARAARERELVNREQQLAHVPLAGTTENVSTLKTNIKFNERQQEAIDLANAGKQFCLIGAAGTGKTTTVKAIIHNLVTKACAETGDTVDKLDGRSILLGSFTNRAVLNIMKAVEDVPGASRFCKTIHKFLAFAPVRELVENEDTGEQKEVLRFVPTYDKDNQLEQTKLIVVEEASMVSVDLFKKLIDACPNASFIFLGDLNQLPPVFGDPILGFKINQLPVIELTEVYRQAMDSPIIAFQHNFTLKGIAPGDSQLDKITEESGGKLTFRPLKNEHKFDGEDLATAIAGHMCNLHKEAKYSYETDIILLPYNKSFGTVIVNKILADYFSQKVNLEPTYEIIAGLDTCYFAVGDFVIHDREEWIIKEIKKNSAYVGSKKPRFESLTMNRFGVDASEKQEHDFHAMLEAENQEDVDLTMLLNTTDGTLKDDMEELKSQASHIVTLVKPHWAKGSAADAEVTLMTRGELNKLDFGYAITVHKSQGSEWEKVHLVMSNKHRALLNRELLYTGMTRAKKELHVIYSPQTAPGRKNSSIAKAIKRQTIRGNTWQEKAKQFFDKQDNYDALMDDSYEQAANE